MPHVRTEPLTTQDHLAQALTCVQDAHGYLLGNPTDGASKAMSCLAVAAVTLLALIRADLGKVA